MSKTQTETALQRGVTQLDNTFTTINEQTIIKRLATQKIKEHSAYALSQVLDIITNTEQNNKEVNETLKGTMYENVNHTYNAINNVLLAHDNLEKSVEKIITSIARVVLVHGKVDFSRFITSLKEFDTFEKYAGLYTENDLMDSKNFKEATFLVNAFFNTVRDYQNDLLNKAMRKCLGAKMVKVSFLSEEVSLIAIFKEYSIKPSSLTLEDYQTLRVATEEGIKAYYRLQNL